MSVVVAFDPDIRSVIGGLLGRIVVYSVLAKMTGHCRRGRLTGKGIGSSNKGSRIEYDNLSKFATTQPKNPSPSTETPAVTQYKDVNKNQNNNNTTDKEDKKK
jgi:hypothetical protein